MGAGLALGACSSGVTHPMPWGQGREPSHAPQAAGGCTQQAAPSADFRILVWFGFGLRNVSVLGRVKV